MVAVVGAPVRAVLGAGVHDLRLLGMYRQGANGVSLGQTVGQQLPAIVSVGHAVQAGFYFSSRSGFSS